MARHKLVTAMILTFHLAGLVAFWQLLHQALVLAPITLGLLLILPGLAYRSHRRFAIETLAPFYFLYAIIAARFVYIRVLGGEVPGYFDYNAPDGRSTLFRLEPWFVSALIFTLALQIRLLASRTGLHILASILIALTFAWASALYIGHRTHGVTGTDPYAYAQMAIDLATRGTPLHRFTLFSSVASLTIGWSPLVHTGYHIPSNLLGDAPTVWPMGGSLAMALAYRIAGEAGLYLVNPIASLLLLTATGWFAGELFADSKYRVWIAALSITVLATSHTLFDWATVPMVDSQAALFSVLAIALSLRGAKRSNPPITNLLLFSSGLALGAAYFVRHTQVLLAPALVILVWCQDAPRRARLRALLVTGLGALLVALPDLWYHQVVFGRWLTPESTELNLFTIASVGDTFIGLNANLLAAREFGWLVPFVVYGAYCLARAKRIEFIAILTWVLGLLGFHLFYPALRPRDLLPEFPPLVIIIAYGVVVFIAGLWRDISGWRKWIAMTGLIGTIFLLLIRVWNVLPIPFDEPQRSFGYLTAEQRAAFERIALLIPSRAVIGSTLNTGALDLYAQRETFIPTLWSPQEQNTFFDAMWSEGREIYLLEDGTEMTDLRRTLETRYTLLRVDVFDVPLFGMVNGRAGTLWVILR